MQGVDWVVLNGIPGSTLHAYILWCWKKLHFWKLLLIWLPSRKLSWTCCLPASWRCQLIREEGKHGVSCLLLAFIGNKDLFHFASELLLEEINWFTDGGKLCLSFWKIICLLSSGITSMRLKLCSPWNLLGGLWRSWLCGRILLKSELLSQWMLLMRIQSLRKKKRQRWLLLQLWRARLRSSISLIFAMQRRLHDCFQKEILDKSAFKEGWIRMVQVYCSAKQAAIFGTCAWCSTSKGAEC